ATKVSRGAPIFFANPGERGGVSSPGCLLEGAHPSRLATWTDMLGWVIMREIHPPNGTWEHRPFGNPEVVVNTLDSPRKGVHLTLDGQSISVPVGTTIWEAAHLHGIDIPVLCHQPRLAPVGVCRLCVVDVGGRVLAASCVRPCEEGMQVQTSGPRL